MPPFKMCVPFPLLFKQLALRNVPLKKSSHGKPLKKLQTHVLPHQVTKWAFINFLLQK